MKKSLQSSFQSRQYMLSEDFEIYYYSDSYQERLQYHVQLHTHDYYEFYFFLEGNVSIRIDDQTCPLKYGDMVLIPPGVPHQGLVQDPSVPYRRFVFWISRSFCSRLMAESPDYGYLLQLADARRHCIFHYDTVAFSEIQSRIFRFLEEIHSCRFGREQQISLCVQDLLLHLNRTVYEEMHPVSAEQSRSLYQNLLRFIELHLYEELSLDRLAQEFYVSKYHIAHVFKENLGISVHSYITKKRLSACCDALRRRRKISEVCLLCGFKDYSGFFRAFRKEFGMTPTEYQALYGK